MAQVGAVAKKRNLVGRVLRVLRVMADVPDREWGVRQIGRLLRISPSGAHRALAVLEQEGFVASDSRTGRYVLTLEFFQVAWRAAAQFPLRRAALPIMQKLVAECNETAFLGLYDPTRTEMMFVVSVESSHLLRYAIELNKWLPVYAGASGLAIMAFLPETERHAIVRRTKLRPVTSRTVTDQEKLEEEMAEIRQRGYALTHGQRVPGAVGLAAPIWGPDSRVVGDLVLTIPEQRFASRSETRLAGLLILYADEITRRIGGRIPHQLGRFGRSHYRSRLVAAASK